MHSYCTSEEITAHTKEHTAGEKKPSTMAPPSTPPPSKKRKTDSDASSNAKLVTPEKKKETRAVQREESPNSIAKCQRCGQKISAGQWRKGVDYGKGYRWWHDDCFDQYNNPRYAMAPTGQAKCVECKEKIPKGTWRVEKEVWEGPPRMTYIKRHYHEDCLSPEEKEALGLKESDKSSSVRADAAAATGSRKRIRSTATSTTTNDSSNTKLRKDLKDLRSQFGRKLGYGDNTNMKLYSNDLVEELVRQKPKNEAELLRIKGMGPKKCRSFGSAILQVIRLCKPKKQTTLLAFFKPKVHKKEEDNDDVKVGDTLSIDQIVQQKFEDAAKNGYLIECD